MKILSGKRWVGLISCTKRKKNRACPASELYSASDHFRRARDFVRTHYDHAYVVSARHGLVDMAQVLRPYNRSLREYTAPEQMAWARFIAANLRLDGMTRRHVICIHADDVYTRNLRRALRPYGVRVVSFAWDEPPSSDRLGRRTISRARKE